MFVNAAQELTRANQDRKEGLGRIPANARRFLKNLWMKTEGGISDRSSLVSV